VLYGKETGDQQDVMFSFTLAESDGYPEHGLYPTDPNLLPWPEYAKKYGPMDKINDSWEFYGKMRMKGFTFTGSGSDMMDMRLDPSGDADGTGNPDKVKYSRRKHFALGLDNLKKIDEHTSLETKVFSDLIEKSQVTGNPNISSDLDHVEESDSSKETRFGLELLYRTRLFDYHDILSGFKFVQTEVDPISQKEVFPLAGSSATLEYNILVAPDEEDKNYAAYLEDNWHVAEDLSIIAGVRVDKNYD
jgi:outer membrane receptor protein involved in Fe transport